MSDVSSNSGITVIRAGWLVSWNGREHQTIENGEVAFQGADIIYAGPNYTGIADTKLNKPDWMICPGFINLHGHIGVELMAPMVDIPEGGNFAASESFSRSEPLNFTPYLTLEQQRASAEFSLVQMLKGGCTTVVDASGSGPIWWLANPPTDEEQLVETVGRIGSRAYLALSFRSGRSYLSSDGLRQWAWDEDLGLAGLEQGVNFAVRHQHACNDRVRTILTPHAAENCSPSLLKATLEAARQNNLLIQIHAAQFPQEVELIRREYGETPIGHLANVGFLGPDIILGHCVYVTGHPKIGGADPNRDLNLIKDAGSSVAHSPLPFARHGEALHSLDRYLNYGINVGIGCDIWPADIISEMRLAWFIGKQYSGDAATPTCADVFSAATVGSADALQRPDLGRLVAGAKADLVCIDLSGYHFGPIVDPIRSLVTCGTGRDVTAVYVDGRLVVNEGTVLAADETALKAEADSIYKILASTASKRDARHRTVQSILSPDKPNHPERRRS